MAPHRLNNNVTYSWPNHHVTCHTIQDDMTNPFSFQYIWWLVSRSSNPWLYTNMILSYAQLYKKTCLLVWSNRLCCLSCSNDSSHNSGHDSALWWCQSVVNVHAWPYWHDLYIYILEHPEFNLAMAERFNQSQTGACCWSGKPDQIWLPPCEFLFSWMCRMISFQVCECIYCSLYILKLLLKWWNIQESPEKVILFRYIFGYMLKALETPSRSMRPFIIYCCMHAFLRGGGMRSTCA